MTKRNPAPENDAVMTTYGMAVGDTDAARLALVDRLYNPSSRAFCESVGIRQGDRIR